jgi:hypothetical protein
VVTARIHRYVLTGVSSVESRFQDGYFLLLTPRRLRVAADEYDPSGVLGIALRHSVSPAHRRGADRAANRFASAAPGRVTRRRRGQHCDPRRSRRAARPDLFGSKLGFAHAACAYSLISPPRSGRRRTRAAPRSATAGPSQAGPHRHGRVLRLRQPSRPTGRLILQGLHDLRLIPAHDQQPPKSRIQDGYKPNSSPSSTSTRPNPAGHKRFSPTTPQSSSD